MAGLEALHKKHGRLPWRDLVLPAVRLAREGFVVDPIYASIVQNYADTIKRSSYGRFTFFHEDGAPPSVGEILKLPVMAKTLEAVAEQGSAHVYRGEWAKECVAEIRAAGGEMSLNDLSDYAPEWSEPLHVTYRGRELYGLNGHNSGGARLLLALKILENSDIRKLGHYSESVDGLETLIRVSRAVNAGDLLASQSLYDDPKVSGRPGQ